MALPAGRYGVTKNQLLKIKKLPMNTIKLIEELTEKFDLLGTAAFKNSTSVVTDSTDLVESGAVYTALQSKMSYADNGILGAKNFWENNVLRNTSPKTTAGVTGTLNANETITITGHNTGTTNNVIECGEIDLKAGNYILSGNPANYEKARPQIYINDSHVYHNLGGDTPFTVESDATNVKLRIYFTTAFTSDDTIVFKPMIRLADDTDSTYQPHAKTNRELTVNKADNSVIGTVEDGATASQAYAVGEHFIRNGKFCTVTQAISSGGTLTEGTNYTTGDVASLLIPKVLTSADNLNNIQETGKYVWLDSTPANSPYTTTTYANMDVTYLGQGIVRQVIYHTNTYIYMRRKASGSWGAWAVFNGTPI